MSMSVTATLLLLSTAFGPPVLGVDYPKTLGANLLGNGGMEVWPLGEGVKGPIPPALWYPMGDPGNLYGQTAVRFSRISSAVAGIGNGTSMMEVEAMLPGNFVAQPLESFAELRGEEVTFSVDITTPFAQATAHVAIDDGVQSTEHVEVVVTGSMSRLTVRHRVAPNATRLQFRIVPEQTLWVDDAQALQGKFPEVRYRPRSNPEPGITEVPLGGVVDWYRFHPAQPVPDRFAIADGGTVIDPQSPFVGLSLPDLRDRFVRGASSPAAIGTTGGEASVDLKHTHSGKTGEPSSSWKILQWPVGSLLDAARSTHTHNFTTNPALDTVPILPPYVGLLKLVRVR